MFKHVMTVIVLLPAYVQAAPTASDCDFNNNGQVDFADFIAFSQGYGTNQTQFDLNGDGAINFQDFIIFVQFYGQTITDVPVGIEVGMKAPDFTLETLTGERFNIILDWNGSITSVTCNSSLIFQEAEYVIYQVLFVDAGIGMWTRRCPVSTRSSGPLPGQQIGPCRMGYHHCFVETC